MLVLAVGVTSVHGQAGDKKAAVTGGGSALQATRVELFYNGVNEQAQAVSFELPSGGKVIWTSMIRWWDLKPCP